MRQSVRRRPPRDARGGTYWIYGRHPVMAALANPARVHRRVVALSETAPSVQQHSPEILERDALADLLPDGAVHQGLALLVERLAEPGLDDLAARAAGAARAAVVVLDQVQDPQNVGAILRSAAALGALGLIVPDRHAPAESGALAKAASGALEAVPVIRATNLARALGTLKEDGFWCVGFDSDAPTTLAPGTLPDRCALVLGAEGKGVRRLTAETCDMMVRIPMEGGIASLNVSAAAAIALFAHAAGA